MEVDFQTVWGTQNTLKSEKNVSEQLGFFDVVFRALFEGFWVAFWSQQIIRFSKKSMSEGIL